MENKIAILLPYKEKFTHNKSGAVSIWVNDYLKQSSLKNMTTVYGNLSTIDKPLLQNFTNIKLNNSFIKTNLNYTKKFYKKCVVKKHKIIEIHNRPESLYYFHSMNKNNMFKLIFVFHNNPLELRGSKSVSERLNILEMVIL